MRGLDHEVIAAAAQWREQGHEVVLVTVADTWGSSPRPRGALLAIREDGAQVGSVSGGCVEQDLVERVRAGALANERPEIVRYGVRRGEAERFGLPCGGTLELIVERLHNDDELHALVAALDRRERVVRRLNIATGEVTLSRDWDGEEFHFDRRVLKKVFGPVWRLLIIGANAPARYLSIMAQALDYAVEVCDPRADMAAHWDVPGAPLLTDMPDDTVRARVSDARVAVVALTHDPKLDDLALMEALVSPAFYVGALGSRANNARRRERLATLGVPGPALSRLHGPVGLPIGSRIPAEIAVAVLAEMTAVRHGAEAHAADALISTRPVMAGATTSRM
jgi:xanthine dehydrogenase accessory factor